MTESGNTRCFDCGGAADQLNEDADGVPCPSCAVRLLETLPGLFHAPWSDASLGPVANEALGEDPAAAPDDEAEAESGGERFGPRSARPGPNGAS